MNKIKNGDKVKIISGKGKGETGTVITKKGNSVFVSGLKTAKKHIKPDQNNAGYIKTIDMPIHISNIMLIEEASGRPSRVSFSVNYDSIHKFKKKTRILKKTKNQS